MKKLLVLMLTGCLIFTACAPKEEAPAENEAAESEQEENTEEVTEDTSTAPEEVKVINPLPDTIDVEQLESCTVAVSLTEGDAYVDDAGAMQMKVTVFVYDLYDMIDVSMMNPGDAIMINGEELVIETLETSDFGDVLINGGLDNGGYELRTDETGVYYLNDYSDMKYWRELGEVTVPVSDEFVYTDASDLDNGPTEWYPGDFLTEGTGIDYNFGPANTTIIIEGGRVIAMNRVYTP